MSSPMRETRLQFMLSKEELELVDTWRFIQRIPTRAAAIRQLLERGMAWACEEKPRSRLSKDIGVLTRH